MVSCCNWGFVYVHMLSMHRILCFLAAAMVFDGFSWFSFEVLVLYLSRC